MAETFCVKHAGKPAVGYCSKCNKPYCEECLDVETGKPVCQDCLKNKAASNAPAATPSPAGALGGSPLNFKGKGLDDDPLGLFGAGGPKIEAPKLAPTPPPFKPPVMPPPKPETHAAPKPMPLMPSPDPSEKLTPSAPKASMDLDSLLKDPPSLKPSFPSMGMPSSTPSSSSTPSTPVGNIPKPQKKQDPLLLLKAGAQKIGSPAYGFFDNLAVRFRVPTLAVIGAAVVLLAAVAVGVNLSANQTAVPLVDSIQPIHFIQVAANQVSEMDITAYSDLENKLQTMGFQPVIQMIVPQVPSPNFFDVSMKPDAGVYGEIIKTPGQLTPHLSFVTVFKNGVWFSTNSWQGTNQSLLYLVDEFFPNDTPDQLYVQHMQALAKLKQEKDWEVQEMSENRYMSAFSDEVRWFLDKKGIPAYQADFAQWH